MKSFTNIKVNAHNKCVQVTPTAHLTQALCAFASLQDQMNIIISKEIELHQYEVRTDREQVLKLLHPDFQEVGESGNNFTLKSILELLGGEEPNGSKIHSQDYESIQLASDVYLLLYKSVTN